MADTQRAMAHLAPLLSTLALTATLAACQPSAPPAPAPESAPAPAPEAAAPGAAPAPAPAPAEAAASGAAASGAAASEAASAAAASTAAVPASELTRLKATGFSPAWVVQVHDGQLQLRVPGGGGPDGTLTDVPAERIAHAEGVDYEGMLDGVKVKVEIRNGPCDKATEGGVARAYHAALVVGSDRHEGCADAL